MERKEIEIGKIQSNSDYMMREELDKELVAQYRESLDVILAVAPIEVYKIGNTYLLTDGFHRIAAARQQNMTTISAIVYEGSMNDAYAAACLANLQHGKPLSRKERKKAICEYIKLKVALSNVAIAREVGVSDVTILRYRRELETEGVIEPQKVRLGTDVKARTVPTSTNVEVEPAPQPPPDPFQEWFNKHVICGDALEIMPALERKFDLAIVDPPYGITTEKWDLSNKHELLAFTRRWLNQVLPLLKPTARLYVFWSREYMFELKPMFDEIIEAYPLHFGGMLVWYFRNVQSQPDSRKRYKLGWEPLFYYYGLDAPDLDFPKTEITGEDWKGKGDIQSDVWTFAIPQSNYKKDKRIHPTQKPLGLYQRIIKTATHTGDSVLDPFAGAGTTAHAALLTGRNTLSIEQNSEYILKMKARLRPVWEGQDE